MTSGDQGHPGRGEVASEVRPPPGRDRHLTCSFQVSPPVVCNQLTRFL